MSIQRMAVLCGLALALAGCGTSPDDLQPGHGRGKQFYVSGKSYDQVWRAAVGAMSRDMNIVEQDRSAGVIKSRVDTGKVVAIFIAPTAPRAEQYSILLMSKKPMESRFIDRDFEPTVAEEFMRRLGP